MLLLILFIALFELSLHSKMPLLGHDNPIWIDQLIIGKWHFAHQGIFPFRFSPHLCGGAPVYGDPESLYYSLAQALALFIHPWWAMQISVAVGLFFGYFGWMRFSEKVVGLKKDWAQLLSLVMIANGFIFIHVASGHFQMHTMALLGWILYLVFDRTKLTTKQLLSRTALFALLSAYILGTAGYNTLIFAAILIVLMLPFEMARIKELLIRLAAFGTAALMICASKLVAVLSFMKQFPRVEGYSHFWQTANIVEFSIKSFWQLFPTRESLKGYTWDIHEKSIYLSPIVWVGLVLGLSLLIKNFRTLKSNKKNIAIAAYSFFVVLFIFQLAKGYGLLVDGFLQLPVIGSLRVASRFHYLLSVLISIVSIYSLFRFSETRDEKVKKLLIRAGIVFTFFSMISGWHTVQNGLVLLENYQLRTAQVESLDKADYTHKSVVEVMEGPSDFIRTGNRCHIELLRKDQPIKLILADTRLHYNDAYNLINPACYQYPEENNCKPGDRIKMGDEENFENFSRGMPVTWKLSSLQHFADYLSLITLIICMAFLVSKLSTLRVSNSQTIKDQ